MTPEPPCQSDRTGTLITPIEKDLGGFSVRRVLPSQDVRKVGPFVFFDHMGPATFAPGDGIDVRPHPHIGLATVTYLFSGSMMHRDSLGSAQEIRPGAVNLMVAGRGIVHSERTPDDARASGQTLEGLQLWLALPETDEDTTPAFHHTPAAELPETSQPGGVRITMLIGDAFGVISPVKTFMPTLFFEAQVPAGQTLTLPQDYAEQAVYLVSGQLICQDHAVSARQMMVLPAGATLHAQQACHLAVVGGAPLGHRHLDWNFVSSSKAKIQQARADWKAGRFPLVPGDEDEFIPLPE